ncbi:MAG: tRNA pseudouridine(55) synthase TruB [Christensenellaceae bacterium]|jgi:tRNA pseudouridine55 synthase
MNGVLNVLKPPGMSSFDVIRRLRRVLGIKKIGHTGTLDPGAAGVLPICVGRATKISEHLMGNPKSYIAEITFGKATDTQDSYGQEIAVADCKIEKPDVERVLLRFTGEIEQQVPMYSAASVNGVRLYTLARQGKTVSKPPRKVVIHKIELIGGDVNRFLLRVHCSKGTYIRTLCKDIGDALGVPAYMSFLLRTGTGCFKIEDSLTLDEVEAAKSAGTERNAFTTMEEALSFLPRVDIPDYLQKIVLTGGTIDLTKAPQITVKPGLSYALYCNEELAGIANCMQNQLKIKTMLKID